MQIILNVRRFFMHQKYLFNFLRRVSDVDAMRPTHGNAPPSEYVPNTIGWHAPFQLLLSRSKANNVQVRKESASIDLFKLRISSQISIIKRKWPLFYNTRNDSQNWVNWKSEFTIEHVLIFYMKSEALVTFISYCQPELLLQITT